MREKPDAFRFFLKGAKPMSRFSSIGFVCSLAVLSGASANVRAEEASLPIPVSGEIVSRVLEGPACTSPIGICTAGKISGHPALAGTFVFVAKTLTPTADTPETGVMQYTGEITIRTTLGARVFLKDAGAINWTKGGTGDVGAVSTIMPGPGIPATGIRPWLKGRLRISGTFTPEAGGKSTYTGYIVLP
jgi:hypothetical protein